MDEGWKDGFFAYKYTYEKNALDNGHNNPENKCFCREGIILFITYRHTLLIWKLKLLFFNRELFTRGSN